MNTYDLEVRLSSVSLRLEQLDARLAEATTALNRIAEAIESHRTEDNS